MLQCPHIFRNQIAAVKLKRDITKSKRADAFTDLFGRG
jgi:hypothetical protein